MDKLMFMIVHHATCPAHTQSFVRCLQSIRIHYPTNTVIVSKTSVSVIPDDVIRQYNIIVHNTPLDNSHIYGAMMLLHNIDDETVHYCLLHDSMALLKPLPETILQKRFYYHWHFESGKDEEERILRHIDITTFTDDQKIQLKSLYDSGNWIGLFGPAFGGDIRTLKKIVYAIGLTHDTLPYFCGRGELMAGERYIALIATFLDVIDPFPGSYSMNYSIRGHPYGSQNTSTLSLEDIQRIPYNSYMFKSWVIRE